MKKKIPLLLGLSLLIAVIGGELASRYILGLGDPPLTVTHPTIEYMFKPSSEFNRFGNYFRTNEYSMRSDDLTQKREKNEIRILVLGDSVPNGGNLTDQSELATEILKESVKSIASVPVYVGNISAGTWSPPNLLAYVEKFGTFDADAAVIILNKGDMFDFPTFEDLNPNTHPTKKPASALGELISRYVAPRITRLLPTEEKEKFQGEELRKDCTPELLELVRKFSEGDIPVYLVYHPSEDEISEDGSFEPKGGYPVLIDFAETQRLSLYSFADAYGRSVREGVYPFRDRYHPNQIGQELMAAEILELFEQDGLTRRWTQRATARESTLTLGKRMKKKIPLLLGLSLLIAVIGGELASRYILGLGDPPLTVTHPTIEHMFKPSSEFNRFGNYFRTNEYSMRSDDLTPKREKNEIRILVLGDSVPNGGNLTDQSELATEILKESVKSIASVPVYVGNISAGTWSPPNLLAYVEKFGTFDADAAVIILNKGDMFDFPTFEDLNPNTHPTKKPASALGELISRYVAPRITRLLPTEEKEKFQGEELRKDCTPELLELVRKFSEGDIPVYLVYHPSEDEISEDGSFEPKGGYPVLIDFAETQRLSLYSFADAYGRSVREGVYPFRDRYHPNQIGQELMAAEILELFEQDGLTRRWSQRH